MSVRFQYPGIRCGIWFMVVLALGIPPTHAGAQEQSSNYPDLMPFEEEKALALSAAPEHLRAGATVHVLTEDGFEIAQLGTNEFSCVVNRDHPKVRKPTCYDAVGSSTVLPVVLRYGQLMLESTPVNEIQAEIRRGFDSGTYTSPGPGVAYMLSDGIRTYNPGNGSFGTFPPHIMFYAPHLTNADIGYAQGQEYAEMPFIGYQGPQGFMIVIVGR